MRILRNQLIELLEEARQQQGLQALPARVQAALVHDALNLLPHPEKPTSKQRVDLHSRTISHGSLHRHLVTIRCPDQAFYLDAVKEYLLRSGIQPINQQTMVAAMQCDDELCEIYLRHPDQHSDGNFMFIALHLSATLVPDCHKVCKDIIAILRSVDLSVRDFNQMHGQLNEITEWMRHNNDSAAELLAWMNDNRYIIFGLRIDNKRLGLMRDYRTMERIAPGLHQEIEEAEAPTAPGIEWLHLVACQHYLYSATNVKVIRICWQNGEKKLHHAILIGHFSRSARHVNASQIPCLSEHWQALQQLSILQHSAFYRREVRTLYDRLPKSLLYSIAPEIWVASLKEIVDLNTPTQTTTAHLKPAIGNLEYLLIAMPANRFGPNILQHIETRVSEHHLKVHGSESMGVGPYRLIIIAIEQDSEFNLDGLAESVTQCIIFWKDRARRVVLKHAPEVDLPATLEELEHLPSLYQELFPPTQFLADIEARETILANCRVMVRAHQHKGAKGDVELHIITCKPLPLGQLVDKIQAFGLTAIQEAVVDFGEAKHSVRISCLHCSAPTRLHQENMQRLRHGLELVFNNEADHDPLNALIVATTLDINQIGMLIGLRNHLVQIMSDTAPTPLSEMFLRYPLTSERLLRIFAALHLPSMPNSYLAQVKIEFEQAMSDVQSLTDDRWFRAMEKLVEAGLRTNAFIRKTGDPFAFKIDPKILDFAPRPLPYREMFVHGTHVEGVHLRGGLIARGGIRHSDRPSDFRTEVLDLMATQVVKNGQIVSTGAKGGFVIRGGSGAPFVLKQYRTFIRTLLEMTDNLVHGEPIAPDGMRINDHDVNDPYLVVAADKGTARFSDDANEESRLARFWLDDAFASGGSQGYDHKVIGITARGAWVCAAHHFELLGTDAYNDPIRVIAIGDMGGDVFGNGMMLNPNMQLIGAFNHSHIFLDPNPNADPSFKERQRLFEHMGGWDQYDTKIISKGGGVFHRTSKSISLSEEAQKALGIDVHTLSGEALIRALLTAKVDMLYNGGIGTYVKASHESNHDVQDPANNNVRINASHLKATVVSEGGNLGFTHSARIEFAANNGILNTDAVDNSAGVDMSDHEVNLKILFSTPSLIHTPTSKRNTILKQVEDRVTEQCLDNNLLQSRCITLAAHDAEKHLPRLTRLRDTLMADKRIEAQTDPFIEDNETLALRPQLAVLLGHEKNRIHDTLDAEQFSNRSCFSHPLLKAYFPESLWRHHAKAMQEHPLSASIIHTEAANHVVNLMGLTAVHHLQSLLDHSVSSIVHALLLAEALLEADLLREQTWKSVDHKTIAARIQHHIQEQIMHFAEELLRLCDVHKLDAAWVKKEQKGLRQFRNSMDALGIGGAENSRYLELLKSASQAGLSSNDAAHLAAMPELTQMASAVHISESKQLPLNHCLKATQACMHLLPFDKLESSLRSAAWSDSEAHSLRREWLHRLTILKERATGQLLAVKTEAFIERGHRLWSGHKHWPDLQETLRGELTNESEKRSSEAERLHLILSLIHLESVIEESQ